MATVSALILIYWHFCLFEPDNSGRFSLFGTFSACINSPKLRTYKIKQQGFYSKKKLKTRLYL